MEKLIKADNRFGDILKSVDKDIFKLLKEIAIWQPLSTYTKIHDQNIIVYRKSSKSYHIAKWRDDGEVNSNFSWVIEGKMVKLCPKKTFWIPLPLIMEK